MAIASRAAKTRIVSLSIVGESVASRLRRRVYVGNGYQPSSLAPIRSNSDSRLTAAVGCNVMAGHSSKFTLNRLPYPGWDFCERWGYERKASSAWKGFRKFMKFHEERHARRQSQHHVQKQSRTTSCREILSRFRVGDRFHQGQGEKGTFPGEYRDYCRESRHRRLKTGTRNTLFSIGGPGEAVSQRYFNFFTFLASARRVSVDDGIRATERNWNGPPRRAATTKNKAPEITNAISLL